MCEFSRMLVAEGRAEGKKEGKLSMCDELVKNGVLTVKEASGYMGISEAEFKRKVKELEKEPVSV